jgi:hypothetical protein
LAGHQAWPLTARPFIRRTEDDSVLPAREAPGDDSLLGEIRLHDGQFCIRGGSASLLLNGQPCTDGQPLHSGDRLQAGKGEQQSLQLIRVHDE